MTSISSSSISSMEWVGWRVCVWGMVGVLACEDMWAVMGRLPPVGFGGSTVKLAEDRAVAASSMHLGFTGWPIIAQGGPIRCHPRAFSRLQRLRSWLGAANAVPNEVASADSDTSDRAEGYGCAAEPDCSGANRAKRTLHLPDQS